MRSLTVSLLAQTLCKDQGGRGRQVLVSGSILAQAGPGSSGNYAPRDSPCLAKFLWGRICFLRDRAKPSGTRNPGQDTWVLGVDQPQEGALTISLIPNEPPSTRRTYALKWNLFMEWCSSHREDPRRCSIKPCCPSCSKGWTVGCPLHP